MTQQRHRLHSLDALRGIAAIGVVLFHFIPYYNELYGHGFEPLSVLEFGRYGVHLFFMLSGFVIFMTLERTPTPTSFGFARAFRLLPALWTGIIITFLCVHAMGPEDRAVPVETALFNFSLLHSFFDFEHVDGAYWSLVIEITFYFWMALMFYTLKSWQAMRRILFAWVAVSYATILLQDQMTPFWNFVTDDLLFAKYAPLFVSGIVLYQWYKNQSLTAVDAGLLVLSVSHALIAYPEPFNYFVLGCYGVFTLAVHGKLDFIANKVTLWLGSLSYSLYIIHQNIGYGIIQHGYNAGLPGQVSVTLAIMVAFTLATIIHYSVEKPALTWFRNKRKQAEIKEARYTEQKTVKSAS